MPGTNDRVQAAESSKGLASALGAYLVWGLVMPLYFKALVGVPAFEIVAHRIIWALPFAVLLLWWLGLLRGITTLLRPRYLGMCAVTAIIITVNWSTYIYAVLTDHLVEAALGYYINPLVSILLGAIILGERPNRTQLVAIGLATTGVLVMTVAAGGLPIISLILALSFGSYGLLRKMMPVAALEGFFLEILLLLVPAALVAAWFLASGQAHFGNDAAQTALMIGSGPLTAVPLILYAVAARLLKLSTIGIMQYMVPTLLVLTAVFVYGEPFGPWRLVAFGFIWAALALYSWSMLSAGRKADGPTKAAR